MTTMRSQPFGTLLRRYRAAAGLTQEELAVQAGMSARSISDLERGVRHTPYKGTVELLAEALQLSPQERMAFATAAGRKRGPVHSSTGTIPGSMSTLPPLVGRTHECALLEQQLAGEGPPLLLLTGEPGIGKTRLLHEAATRAREGGWSVLEGSCSRRGGQLPYAPLLEALAGRLHSQSQAQLRADLEGCAWLVRLLPELAEAALLLVPEWQLPPEQERRLMFAAVARYLENIAGPAGTLLVLDDLQWAGADALDLLTTLIRSLAQIPLRVVGAYRNTEVLLQGPLSAMLADLARDGLVRQIEIGPLEAQEAATLISSLLAETMGDEGALAKRVLERAGGVPFFLISCVKWLLAGALNTRAGERAATIPWDVRQTIRQRVAALPEAAQELLGVAAVAGRVVRGQVLVAAATWPEREVLIALDAASQARLLVEEADAYQFAHDLIREVVEADLSAARYRVLHRQVAVALERGPEACPAEVLAYHYGLAGELEGAIRYLVRAAESARRAAAHHEEANLLAQAIDFAGRTGQRQLVLELHAQRGTACRAVARWAEADVELTAALDGLPAEQGEQRAEALVTLAEVRHWLQDVPSTRRYATEALALAEQIRRDDLAARAMSALAHADSSDGDIQTSLEHLQQAFVRAGSNCLVELVSGVDLSGMIHYWMGHFEDAIEANQRALELAQQTYDTTSTARALANLGLAFSGKGRYNEALQVFADARRFAQEHRMGQWLARAIAMCGGIHLEVFDFAGAQALAEEAREISRSLNCLFPEISGGIDLLLNFARCQEVGHAEMLLPEVAEAAVKGQGAHGWLWRLRLAQARAEIALARGEWEEAIRWANDAIGQGLLRGRVKYQALGLETRAKALAALGRKHDAIASLQSAVTLARPTGDPAMFLRAAVALLSLAGDDALLAEARTCADTIVEALRDEEMIHRFRSAEALRILKR